MAVSGGIATSAGGDAIGGAVVAAAPVVLSVMAAVAAGSLVSGLVGDAVDNLFSWFSD